MLRLAPLSQALAGRRLARTVYSLEGKPLLAAGTSLTPNHISALAARGFTRVYILDGLPPEPEPVESVAEGTWINLVARTKQAFDSLAAGNPAALAALNKAVDTLIDEIERPHRLYTFFTRHCFPESIYTHSVQVCVLSLVMGTSAGYSRLDLHKLGVGALLHDIGKCAAAAPAGSGAAASEDHSVAGFNLLRKHSEVSLLSAHVAFQHHEHPDGSGYPRALRGKEIHEFARITAVANVFDGWSIDPPGGARLSRHALLGCIRELAGTRLDADFVHLLLGRIAHYPDGCLLALDTGHLAVVAAQNPEAPARPRVLVLADPDGRPVTPQEVDLAEHPGIAVADTMEDFPPAVERQLRRLAQCRK